MIDFYVKQLKRILEEQIRHELSEVSCAAVGYSGGLDCSVIAKLASKFTELKLYVVGVEDSQDISSAERGAQILKMPLEKIFIEYEDVKNALPQLIEILRSRNAMEISIEMALYFLCKTAEEKVVLVGQGADELFGGYSRYLRLEPVEREDIMRSDVERYLQHNLMQEKRLARVYDKELIAFYTSPPVVEFTGMLEMEYKIRKNERKYILKELARKLELPKEIVDKPKKAVQYGSGILNLLKVLSKEQGLELHEYLKKI